MTMVIDCTELLDVFMAKIPTSCDGINAGGYPYMISNSFCTGNAEFNTPYCMMMEIARYLIQSIRTVPLIIHGW